MAELKSRQEKLSEIVRRAAIKEAKRTVEFINDQRRALQNSGDWHFQRFWNSKPVGSCREYTEARKLLSSEDS